MKPPSRGPRNLHVMVPNSSYIRVKVATFERQLSLQDTLGGFMALIAEGDERATRLLDELALEKWNGTLHDHIQRGVASDVDSGLLYDLLERDGK